MSTSLMNITLTTSTTPTVSTIQLLKDCLCVVLYSHWSPAG